MKDAQQLAKERYPKNSAAYAAFIAGHGSRDAEFEFIKNELNFARLQLEGAREAVRFRNAEIGKLVDALTEISKRKETFGCDRIAKEALKPYQKEEGK